MNCNIKDFIEDSLTIKYIKILKSEENKDIRKSNKAKFEGYRVHNLYKNQVLFKITLDT